MAEVKLRSARFEDHAAIAALEASQGLASKPFEEWRRFWLGNPLYEKLGPSWPIGWVLETAGRIVGCVFGIPLPYVFPAGELPVGAGHGWAVDDEYRGYALMLLNEHFSRPKVNLFIDTTVNANAANAFATFGSQRTPLGDWANAALLVTRPRGFTESALRIKGFSLPTFLSYPPVASLWVSRTSLPRKHCPKTALLLAYRMISIRALMPFGKPYPRILSCCWQSAPRKS